MIGLAGPGVQGYVVARHGEAAWHEIEAVASCMDRGFSLIDTHDVAESATAIEVIARRLGLTEAAVLLAFGRFWIACSAQAPLNRILRPGGRTLAERLGELDGICERLGQFVPGLEPPRFRFEEGGAGPHRLFYRSPRTGLQAVVEGFLLALAEDCGEPIAIYCREADLADWQDVFEISLLAGDSRLGSPGAARRHAWRQFEPPA